MWGVRKFALLLVAALLATGLAACGDSDSGDSTAASTAPSTQESESTPASPENGGSGDDSSAAEGSASFLTPGGDNSIQNFGEEADSAQVDEVSTTLSGYLEARAEDDWAKQCALLAKPAVAPLEQLAARSPQFKGQGCAAVLESLLGTAPASSRADTLTNGVASLRFEGDRGFALYHGAGGVDYFMSMIKEDGQWKVGAFAPNEFP
jgi:hypothetical protein